MARGEEATGETGEAGTEGERREFDHGGVQAQRTASDLVFTQRFPGTTDGHAQQAVDHEQRQQGQQQGNQVEEDHLVDRVVLQTKELVEGLHAFGGLAFKGQAEKGGLLDVTDAVRTAGQTGEVTQEQADDLTETQGHDRQVVTAQAQYREAEQETEGRRHHAGDRQTDPEAPAKVVRQQGVAVGADGVEADIAQVEQASQTHHDVQAQAQQHVDQDQGSDVDCAA
ncbi:hypothetical protein D3C77_463060 [compost metagenome]